MLNLSNVSSEELIKELDKRDLVSELPKDKQEILKKYDIYPTKCLNFIMFFNSIHSDKTTTDNMLYSFVYLKETPTDELDSRIGASKNMDFRFLEKVVQAKGVRLMSLIKRKSPFQNEIDVIYQKAVKSLEKAKRELEWYGSSDKLKKVKRAVWVIKF